MPDMQCVVESNFGEAEYKVKFDKISCSKRHFYATGDFIDVNALELFGLAIHTAKQMKNTDWFLTKERNLVCGVARNKLPTLAVNIDIVENLEWLSSPVFKQRMKPNHGFKVKISGLDEEAQRSRFWCVFSPPETI